MMFDHTMPWRWQYQAPDAWSALPEHHRSQRLEILVRQLHKEALAALPAPAIALDAADEPLAVVIDLDERAIAAEAYIKWVVHLIWPVQFYGYCTDTV
jgi:hypothetical protein